MDDRIEKIYEAEKAAVQKRDELAQQQKAKREEVKKAYAAEKETAHWQDLQMCREQRSSYFTRRMVSARSRRSRW